MSGDHLRAKVFISCGQGSDQERQIAREVGAQLDSLGFDYYIAVEEQSLRGLKDNIFSQLGSSEYFLFIDFKREQFANSSEYRGSLFSQQELAIASYLDLPVMAFRERGVKKLDGLMTFLQGNAVEFSDPRELLGLIRSQLTKNGWRPDWKDSISVSIPVRFVDVQQVNGAQRPARFYHLEVKNHNPQRMALNCTGYVESVYRMPEGELISSPTVELRWAGFALPQVAIPPLTSRLLDGGFIYHSAPQMFLFNAFTTSTMFAAPLRGTNTFQVTFIVISENFPPTRAVLEVRLRNRFDEVDVRLL